MPNGMRECDGCREREGEKERERDCMMVAVSSRILMRNLTKKHPLRFKWLLFFLFIFLSFFGWVLFMLLWN